MDRDFNEQVTERVVAFEKAVDKEIASRFPVPFGMEKMTAREQREAFERLTVPEMMALIQRHGEGAVNEYIKRMKGGGHGTTSS